MGCSMFRSFSRVSLSGRCFLFFSLFKAAGVLWFPATRTVPFWWRTSNNPGILTMPATDRQSIQSEMRDILQALIIHKIRAWSD
ncbi:hypothetical protein BJ741DRAFT_627791 [Chytriomyces cf. hyalinus JEL632]|nr:hypothetical protein BJ741DRAFT_627791 [Chytriomyces cf. hyalinus JEL632]